MKRVQSTGHIKNFKSVPFIGESPSPEREELADTPG
jgi:hypothetical protein